jgi:hypothetical protein
VVVGEEWKSRVRSASLYNFKAGDDKRISSSADTSMRLRPSTSV